MNGTPLTLLQPVEQFEKDLEQREDEATSKCAYFGHHILTGTKIFVFVIGLLTILGYIIFQSIRNLMINHFPKSVKRKVQQVTISCRNHLR